MPELPEVQSTVDYLSKRLVGRSILDCDIFWGRSIATHNPKAFKSFVLGKKISQVTRRGKFIVISLDTKVPHAILIHLRMSGTIEVISSKISRDPYDRVVISLDNSKELRFNDVRKFGKIYLSQHPHKVLGKLGIEPLSSEFSSAYLLNILCQKKGAIKPLLLNQTYIAGIGNIYADESLWRAKIHPKQLANKISKQAVERLHAAIVSILEEAINLKGTDNGDEVVSGGMYQPKVYGRSEEACSRCKSKIIRIVVGQRGTHYCGRCQKI